MARTIACGPSLGACFGHESLDNVVAALANESITDGRIEQMNQENSFPDSGFPNGPTRNAATALIERAETVNIVRHLRSYLFARYRYSCPSIMKLLLVRVVAHESGVS